LARKEVIIFPAGSPDPRKAFYMIVTNRWGLAAAAWIGLALASCTTEEGPVYDVRAREQAGWLTLDIDNDGTPLILAQINMYYATTAKLGEWDPLYNSINSQTVLFAKTAGGWKSHGFRNLGEQWSNTPLLIRNEKGSLQPMVWDRNRINLYTGSGNDWTLKTRRPVRDPYAYWGFSNVLTIRLVGDSGWQSITRASEFLTEVVDQNGISARLDSARAVFMPMGFLHGADWAGVVGREDDFSIQGGISKLVWYRWNSDLKHPSVAKTVLDSLSSPASLALAQVKGEWRMNAILNAESLATWVLKGNLFERLPDQPFPWGEEDTASGMNSSLSMGALHLDAQGCLHKMLPILPSRDSVPEPGKYAMPKYVHLNSCGSDPDTLNTGRFATGKDERVVSESIRVGPEGTVAYAVTVQEIKENFIGSDWQTRPVLPSRIELAFKRPGGKWVYETVAKF
jgi:hypothetical protein